MDNYTRTHRVHRARRLRPSQIPKVRSGRHFAARFAHARCIAIGIHRPIHTRTHAIAFSGRRSLRKYSAGCTVGAVTASRCTLRARCTLHAAVPHCTRVAIIHPAKVLSARSVQSPCLAARFAHATRRRPSTPNEHAPPPIWVTTHKHADGVSFRNPHTAFIPTPMNTAGPQ